MGGYCEDEITALLIVALTGEVFNVVLVFMENTDNSPRIKRVIVVSQVFRTAPRCIINKDTSE